jgi:polyphosphate kinase
MNAGAGATRRPSAPIRDLRDPFLRQLLVAPVSLRRNFSRLAEREMAHARDGRPARVIIKCNALSDPRAIRVLYRASQAGVPIDLIIRGICCLRPGVPGVSDTITVRSIVGRFLEHSRIWYFENGGEPEVYIGSADLMERNLNTRVEAVCPVLDPELRQFVRDTLLDAYLADTLRTSVLRSDGQYEAIPGADHESDAQSRLMKSDTRAESDAEPLDTP